MGSTHLQLHFFFSYIFYCFVIIIVITSEMETGRVDRHRLSRRVGRVAGRVEILRPAGQAG